MARREADQDVAQSQRPIVRLYYTILDKLLLPVRILTSKFALRAYLTSILFFITGLLLFGFAVVAYVLFYWSYIPRIGFTRDVHLQFDPIPIECRTYLGNVNPYTTPYLAPLTGATPPPQRKSELTTSLSTRCAGSPAPWGTAPVSPEVISQQAYDVVVELTMPLTPLNTEAGNFMIDGRFLSSPAATDSLPQFINNYDPFGPSQTSNADYQAERPLAHSRRPALIPYQPPLVNLFSSFTALPRYVLGLQTSTTTLRVPLFTQVSFPRGRRAVPSSIHIQLQNPSGVQLQVYSLKVHFRARFTGLRYLMYNFRTASGVVFISAFFVMEVVSALGIYGFLSFVVFGGEREQSKGQIKDEPEADDSEAIKDEETETEGLSTTERTFPSYGGGMPMRYTQPKKEGESSKSAGVEGLGGLTNMTPGPGGEADDEEDEDADFVLDDTDRWRDSGLGTSMESGRERNAVRRRRSRPSSREGGLR